MEEPHSIQCPCCFSEIDGPEKQIAEFAASWAPHFAVEALIEACQQAEHWLTAEAQSPHPGATKPDMILSVLRNALAKAEGIPF